MLGVTPLWRRAVLRSLPPGGWGLLLVAALLAATTSAASAPLVIEQSDDNALTSTLEVVPEDARIADTAALRVVGGRSPRSEDSELLRMRVDSIPGLTPTTLTAVSVGPESHFGSLFRPLVANGDRTVRARLAAVEDPEASLVVTARDPQKRAGAWLPEPVAEELGVEPGDVVTVLVQQYDKSRPPPPEAPPTVRAPLTVAGLYAVAADGRRPADLPGSTTWSRRKGVIPPDSELANLSAYLVVTDVTTADRAGEAIGDDLLWAVESELEPGVSLETAKLTAAEVDELRRDVRAVDEPIGPVRVGLASGIEALVAQASSLADATAERVRLLAYAGVTAGLLALLALAVLLAADRRRELRHGAAVGVGPVRVAGLWLVESLLPAAVAAALGVGCAWLLLRALDPDGVNSRAVATTAWRNAALVSAVGVLAIAVVGAIACAVGERPESVRGRRRVPWVALVTALAVTALVATLTTPATAPGPVALAVPALVAVSVGGILTTLVAWLLRLRRAAALPRSVPRAARWLALRRLARAGGDQVLAASAMTLGLALVLFAVSGVAATRTVVADRTAVKAGAAVAAQLAGSWALVPNAPKVPTQDELAKGKKIPEGKIPTVPAGDSVVWRSLASVGGDYGYRDVLTIDPATFDASADWGQGAYLAEVRRLTAQLIAEGATRQENGPIPVISVNDPALNVGDVVTISGQEWESSVRVIADVSAYPGLGDRPMLVATAPTLLPRWGRGDPRLAPASAFDSPRAYAEAWVWSSGEPAPLTSWLERHGAAPIAVTTQAQAARQPALVAAESTLGFQLVLTGFLALAAVVAAALHSRRVTRRSRAADALLARSGMGVRGVRRARTWESLMLVGLAFLSALVSVSLITRMGPLLLDLDRSKPPALELSITPAALVATLAAAAVMLAVAWWVGARDTGGGRGRSPEEVVLRDGQ